MLNVQRLSQSTKAHRYAPWSLEVDAPAEDDKCVEGKRFHVRCGR